MCCVVSGFRSSLLQLGLPEVLGRLDFSSAGLVAGQFGKTAGKFYPGGRKVFDPILIVFWVFPFRVVWGLFSSRKIRSKSRNGFPRVCVCRVVSGFRSSLRKLVGLVRTVEVVGSLLWVFSWWFIRRICRKVLSRRQEGFTPSFWRFLGFSVSCCLGFVVVS